MTRRSSSRMRSLRVSFVAPQILSKSSSTSRMASQARAAWRSSSWSAPVMTSSAKWSWAMTPQARVRAAPHRTAIFAKARRSSGAQAPMDMNADRRSDARFSSFMHGCERMTTQVTAMHTPPVCTNSRRAVSADDSASNAFAAVRSSASTSADDSSSKKATEASAQRLGASSSRASMPKRARISVGSVNVVQTSPNALPYV
ncbi:hypothetical protein M885DRAFT_552847 [Pelagophyceae sp. CCMP2097]|nr:hypothetical protein M885DRAFT_552847 [Pelagophyceae sp. CCMP2097]|mmetsp:Transcript_22801/g.79227  ORF Transcript_22801/g.79227 Transcript_22801/m.79227 type:complete len:201 (+) Transcript_22801:1344-1946(+)